MEIIKTIEKTIEETIEETIEIKKTTNSFINPKHTLYGTETITLLCGNS